MRSVDVARVTDAVREMCIEVNHKLSPDMARKFPEAREREESPLGRQILGQLIENMEIARTEMIPRTPAWPWCSLKSGRTCISRAAISKTR